MENRASHLRVISTAPLGLGQSKERALHCLLDESTTPKSSERDALETIASNLTEHTYIRALAALVLARSQTHIQKRMNKNEWGDRFARLTTDLTMEQVDELVWAPLDYSTDYNTCTYIQLPMHEYMYNPRSILSKSMAVFDPQPEHYLDLNPLLKLQGDGPTMLHRLCIYGFGADTLCRNICGTVKTVNKTQESLSLSISKLKKCDGCRAVYYCSRECQFTHWKAGHKLYCRPINELKKGDLVTLHGLVSASHLNKKYRELGDYIEAKGRWEVTWIGGTNGVLIKPENIRRIVTAEEKEALYRQYL
ncbi:hypothetical protein HDU79_010279, partial [Rhizoclosmatium sp. JEL0117]